MQEDAKESMRADGADRIHPGGSMTSLTLGSSTGRHPRQCEHTLEGDRSGRGRGEVLAGVGVPASAATRIIRLFRRVARGATSLRGPRTIFSPGAASKAP